MMVLLMIFSTFINSGLPVQADEHNVEQSELELEKEREQQYLNESESEPQPDSEPTEELFSLLSGLGYEPQLTEPTTPRQTNAPPKIDKNISQQLQENEQVDVIIHLEDEENFNALYQEAKGKSKAERSKLVMDRLQAKANASQQGIKQALTSLEEQGHAQIKKELWINNSIVASINQNALEAIEARDDVKRVQLDEIIKVPEVTVESAPQLPEWGLEKINAPQVWGEYGVNGEGIVVGIMDTGVDATHEALKHNYRGRDGSHEYSWIDLSGEGYETPTDGNGHGTHVAGTSVGGGEGEPIGVAPGAEWIAAKIFNDGGSTTTSAIHEAFQWFIAPGGDPSKAPHVVNNSWGNSNTYNLEFYEDVQAWVSAGIFPLFAAGNDGPGSQTIGSPGSFIESFAIGATDRFDQIASFSSRGPVYWENENGEMVSHIKPDISAPGHEIYSAWPTQLSEGPYHTISGTSMATPHVAGAIALLLSANPDLSIDQVADLLENTARVEDHMGELPNTLYGSGIVNIYQAVTEAAYAGELQGSLTNEHGEPISGDIILPEQDLTISVDETGQFSYAIREGTHDAIIQSFGYESFETTITIQKDQTTEVSWQLDPAESYNVTGQVTFAESGEGVPYAFIRVKDTPLQTVRTDMNGQFEISQLPVGSYELQVTGEGIHGITQTIDVNSDLTLNLQVEENPEQLDQDWNTNNQNYQRNAISPNSIDVEQLDHQWSYLTDSKGQILFSTPATTDNKVILTTDRGWIVALNLQTGEEIWSLRFGDTNRSNPTIENGTVYVSGGSDQHIYALDLDSGRTIWSQNIGQPAIYESPIVHNGQVFIASSLADNASLFALNAEDGTVNWSISLGSSSFFGPALGDGYLYVGTYDNKTLRAINPDDGSEIWSYQPEENEGFASPPVYQSGVVYALSTNMDNGAGSLHAIDGATGELLWKNNELSDAQAASPIVFGDLVIVSSSTQPVIKAIDMNSGEEVWSQDAVGTTLNNGSISSNGLLFISNTNGLFFTIDVYTGEILNEETLPDYSSSTPLILPGTVLVPHLSGVESFVSPGSISGTIVDKSGNPLEATVTVTETGEFVEAQEDGTFTLHHAPGDYQIKVSLYGHQQAMSDVSFVSGYDISQNFTLPEAETGSLALTVYDNRSSEPIEGVEINLENTPISGTTNANGQLQESSVYEGTYDLTLQLNGYQSLTESITIEKGTDNQFEFNLQPIGIAVLNDYESEITELLNLNGYSAEERDWDIIDDIGRYEIVYLNGAYTTDGWKPDEETFNELVNAANAADVSLVFADTWGSSYGSIHHLTDYFQDPEELEHAYSAGTINLRVDENHPIFDGYEVGDYLTLMGGNSDFAWFNQYSGRDLASIGSTDLGFVGTGVAYKPVSENSAHLLLSAHSASPWTSPFQGWLQDSQNIFLNSIDYLLTTNFGKVTGSVSNESGETLDASVEVVETGYTFEYQGEMEFFHDEGTYTLKVRAAGYETETLEIEVENGTPVELDLTLQSSEGGSIAGIIRDTLTEQPLGSATVKLKQNDDVISELTTDVNGRYELQDLNDGQYQLEVTKEGYILETINFEITASPIERDIALTSTPNIAVLSDYYSSDSSFASVFEDIGVEVEELSSSEVIERLGEFDVLFINGLGYSLNGQLDEIFAAADESETSLVFGETLYSSSPINELIEYRGDPENRYTADHGSSAGYVVTEDHRIFGDYSEGDFIEILLPSNSQIGYFDGYSGYSLADMKHKDVSDAYGNGLVYKPRTENSLEMLLGGYSFNFRHHKDHYTEEGRQLLIDTIVWAAHADFPTISGTITDQEGQPIDATVQVVNENFNAETDENGQFSIALLEGDYEIEVQSFGYETMTLPVSAVKNGEPLDIQMEVGEEAASIQGVVENERDGQAISEVDIQVNGQPRSTTTNTQGAFSIDRLEPGEYTLTFAKDGYVMKEAFIELSAGQSLELPVQMKPSPTVGIIVDNNSNDATLANYLEGRGYHTTELFYTDLDRLSELDIVIANSDYDRDQEPTEEEFNAFINTIDEQKLSVIWTGHVNGRGGIRFLHQFENNPYVELEDRQDNVMIQATESHPITEGVNLDESYPLENRSNYYYAFDEYDGQTVTTLEHPEDGYIGDMVAYKGRTTESVEVLLANTTFGYYFNPDVPEYFDPIRERLINNSILWALDNREALAADVHGTLNNDLESVIQGNVTVLETGKTVETNNAGEFYLGLQEGTYTLQIEAFGHQTQEFALTVENGEVYNETFTLQSNEIGTITGSVMDGQTEKPIAGATIQVMGTPLTVETDANGQYELTAPAGVYNLRAMAPGYTTQTQSDVQVNQNEVTDVSFLMQTSEKIAVITQSYNQDRFESIMSEYGYAVDYIDYTELEGFIDQIGDYALVIYNNSSYSTTDEIFTSFVHAADENQVSIIFASQYGGGTIGDLSDVFNDPADVEYSFVPSHINIKTLTNHPLFAGIDSEEFRIIDDGDNNQQYAVYSGYSGTTIGSISHDDEGVLGEGIGYDFRTANSVHLLLSGFQVGSYSDPDENWTEDAKVFYNNAINWAMHASLGEIRGSVTNEDGEPVANAQVSIPALNMETRTDAQGEYRIGIGTGTYEVHVSARGYHEAVDTVTVQEQGDSAELNFALEAIEGSSINGQVMDAETGDAIQDADVSLIYENEVEPIETIQTDENGQFQFGQLLPDNYVVQVKADGYIQGSENVTLGDEPVSVNLELNGIKVAVVGDQEQQIETLLNENQIYAEGRDWDVVNDVTNYELVIINANDGTKEDLEALIQATDEHGISLVFLGTWGVDDGSIPTLNETLGYPELDQQGYNEGEVVMHTNNSSHPIFAGLPESFVVHSEKSPYATFKGYPGPTLSELSVDEENKGTAVSYEYRSATSIHLLLSSFAVNNIISPNYGWTEEGKTLFTQAIEYAMNAQQEPPSIPEWDETQKKTKENLVTLTGQADPHTTVHIYETKGNEETQIGTTQTNANGEFSVELEIDNGNHFLHLEAENLAGTSDPSEQMQLIVTGKPNK